jgi:hypothetical protein
MFSVVYNTPCQDNKQGLDLFWTETVLNTKNWSAMLLYEMLYFLGFCLDCVPIIVWTIIIIIRTVWSLRSRTSKMVDFCFNIFCRGEIRREKKIACLILHQTRSNWTFSKTQIIHSCGCLVLPITSHNLLTMLHETLHRTSKFIPKMVLC